MTRAEDTACRAWQLLMRFFFAQRAHLPSWERDVGLSAVQCHVLHLIEPGRPIPMSRLAATLACDASNVTGLVDRLEARGLVLRRPSPDDRRVKVLELTTEGNRFRSSLLRRMTRPALPLGRLSTAEQQTLVRLLERLLDDDSEQSR